MASCFFLLKQFEDVLIYFNSIKSYFYNDDSFNFNYAQAKAANGNFKEAEEVPITTTVFLNNLVKGLEIPILRIIVT